MCRCAELLFVLWCAGVCIGLQCASPRPSELKFSITSSRNQTGHMVAQVQVEQGDNEGRLLKVDVDHTTIKCKNSESILIIATITAPPRLPGPDYELVPGLGYYKLHTDLSSWYEARLICIQEGAHLAVINSEAETKALLKFWFPHPRLFDDWRNNWAHIGIHDHYNEGQYVTIFDVPLNATGFNRWNSNEPNGSTTQNCIGVRRNTGGLADVVCSDKLAFFCEQEL